MAKRMLIDGTHAEEVRVALVNGSRLDDYDFEIDGRRPLKGNIYLAKVTRVEPSLQAAFVEYGGNRHGFLPFSEIHTDYYKIPTADRIAFEKAQKAADEAASEAARKREEEAERRAAWEAEQQARRDSGEDVDDEEYEELGGDDVEEAEEVPRPQLRDYKIQEVIRRNQIMLIQVSKEERGQKGAALTTYLSLAGRYCVLMPNSPRGGGISRKISNPADRKRLKQTLASLKMQTGMSVILRTAGLNRTKPEIRRDFEYLSRLWDNIRELTMTSHAPALIYEEGDLIKRTIRDIYSKEFDEVLVSGDDAYRQTKDFMRMLMPSHARKVQKYGDAKIPLFYRYQVEPQIDAIHKPVVQLKSGGYLVINPTEALVSIDVNSGRATRERHIEETAYNTNMEAAEEVARQLRLRDLAGLVVIDFIDMEDVGNNKKVERKLKDSLHRDRARIQVGRISQFGLLEMSRQRLRPSIMESSYETCPHCSGTGHLRSVDGSALHVLRALDEEGMRRRTAALTVHIPTDVALYLLNQKRAELTEMERRWQFEVTIDRDDHLVRPDFRIDRTLTRTEEEAAAAEAAAADTSDLPVNAGDTLDAEREQPEPETEDKKVEEQKDEKPKRRRTRRRRGRKDEQDQSEVEAAEQAEAADPEEADDKAETKAGDDEDKPKRRRRRRRGGRGRRRKSDADAVKAEEESGQSDSKAEAAEKKAEPTAEPRADEKAAEAKSAETADDSDDASDDDKPKRRRRGRRGGRRRSRRSGEDAKADQQDAQKDAGDKASDNADAKKSDDKKPVEAKAEPEAHADPKPAQKDEPKEAVKSSGNEPSVRQPRRRSRSRRSTRPVPGKAKADDSEDSSKAGSAAAVATGTVAAAETAKADEKPAAAMSERTATPDPVAEIEAEAEEAASRRALEDISDDEALDEIWAATASHRSEAADLPGPAADADEVEAEEDVALAEDEPLEDVAAELDAEDDLSPEDDPDAALFDPFGNPPVKGAAEDEIDPLADDLSDDLTGDPALTAASSHDEGDDGEDDGELPDWAPTDPAELELATAGGRSDEDEKKGWWKKLMDG